jgi:hypothetical protein
MRKARLEFAHAVAEEVRRRNPDIRTPHEDLVRLTMRYAREHEWCDPKRVAECYGCACRKDARRHLRAKAARRARKSR